MHALWLCVGCDFHWKSWSSSQSIRINDASLRNARSLRTHLRVAGAETPSPRLLLLITALVSHREGRSLRPLYPFKVSMSFSSHPQYCASRRRVRFSIIIVQLAKVAHRAIHLEGNVRRKLIWFKEDFNSERDSGTPGTLFHLTVHWSIYFTLEKLGISWESRVRLLHYSVSEWLVPDFRVLSHAWALVRMRSDSMLALLNFCVLLRASAGQVCAPCTNRACPPVPAQGCEEGRVLARDPCGCCDQCARLELEVCGGENWQQGYCAPGLTCTALNHTGAITIPDKGVCKGECKKDRTLSFCLAQ